MTTEITARDKLLVYVVGMLAFIFFFVQFMLTPALEASDEAAASLAEAQQAQIAMQETIALLQYMVNHNAAHANELAQLGQKLTELGNREAGEQVLTAVSEFEKGNLRLSTVLASLK